MTPSTIQGQRHQSCCMKIRECMVGRPYGGSSLLSAVSYLDPQSYPPKRSAREPDSEASAPIPVPVSVWSKRQFRPLEAATRINLGVKTFITRHEFVLGALLQCRLSGVTVVYGVDCHSCVSLCGWTRV